MLKKKNFAKTLCAEQLTIGELDLTITTGEGVKFPAVGAGNTFMAVLWGAAFATPEADTTREIVLAYQGSTDVMTIVRAQEGTTAKQWEIGDNFMLIASSAVFDEYETELGLKLNIADKNTAINNLLKNGNFINNSSNGYGGTPDDFISSNANPVQGGFPEMTKQQLIDLLGITDGDIEGLWNLNEASGNAVDLSSNAYHLTDTNTVGASDDGLMGKARDFEAGNTEYFNITHNSCPNLDALGNKTLIWFMKPESLHNGWSFGMSDAGLANYYGLGLNLDGTIRFWNKSGESIDSDVKYEAGKWYMVVGVGDVSGNVKKIWVNGIKKQSATCSTTGDITGGFSIGRLGDFNNAGYFLDGLVQLASVLSVALTDSQVKKLFAATLYRGQKIRRATTDAYLYQSLPEDLVERLRGKQLTLRADMFQGVASTAQISIYDGTETLSAADVTTGSWLEKSVTKTISTTATQIQIRIKHSTADGNTWFRKLALYEGLTLLPYDHSQDDWSRFPRLLKMDIPAVFTGYQFEERRWFDYVPTVYGSAGSAGSYAQDVVDGKFLMNGKNVSLRSFVRITNVGSWSGNLHFSIPVLVSANITGNDCPVNGMIIASGAVAIKAISLGTDDYKGWLFTAGLYTSYYTTFTANDCVLANGNYEID